MTYRSSSTDRFDWLGNSFEQCGALFLSNPNTRTFKQFNEFQTGCLRSAMKFDYEFDMRAEQIKDRRKKNMRGLSASENSLSLSQQNFRCTKPLKQSNRQGPTLYTPKSEYYTDEVLQKSVTSQWNKQDAIQAATKGVNGDQKKESNLFSCMDNTSYDRKMELCPLPINAMSFQRKKMSTPRK